MFHRRRGRASFSFILPQIGGSGEISVAFPESGGREDRTMPEDHDLKERRNRVERYRILEEKLRTQLRLVCFTISFWTWKPSSRDRRKVTALMPHKRQRDASRTKNHPASRCQLRISSLRSARRPNGEHSGKGCSPSGTSNERQVTAEGLSKSTPLPRLSLTRSAGPSRAAPCGSPKCSREIRRSSSRPGEPPRFRLQRASVWRGPAIRDRRGTGRSRLRTNRNASSLSPLP